MYTGSSVVMKERSLRCQPCSSRFPCSIARAWSTIDAPSDVTVSARAVRSAQKNNTMAPAAIAAGQPSRRMGGGIRRSVGAAAGRPATSVSIARQHTAID
jgi:hypothetical protein